MKKKLSISTIIAIITSISSIAHAAQWNPSDVSSIHKTITGYVIEHSVEVPSFIQFSQSQRNVPSCGLLSKDKKTYLALIAFDKDDPSDFSRCSEINHPIIKKINGIYYAVFPFSEEQTEGEFSTDFKVVALDKHSFISCSNSDNSDFNEKYPLSKKRKSMAVNNIFESINKHGCLK